MIGILLYFNNDKKENELGTEEDKQRSSEDG